MCAGPGFSLTFSLGNCTFDDKAIHVCVQAGCHLHWAGEREPVAIRMPPHYSSSATSLRMLNGEAEVAGP